MIERSEDSGSNVLQPIDVGLRGEHYLDSEADEAKNSRTLNGNDLRQPQIIDDKCRALLNDGKNKEIIVGQGRSVQRVSNKKKNRTSDLRKYLSHALSINADGSHQSKQPRLAANSTAFSSNYVCKQSEIEGPRHSQSCYNSKFNPSFQD